MACIPERVIPKFGRLLRSMYGRGAEIRRLYVQSRTPVQFDWLCWHRRAADTISETFDRKAVVSIIVAALPL